MDQERDRLVAQIAQAVEEAGLQVGVVESLTSGALASALGRGESASAWFRGAIVAYEVHTKEALLGVAPGTDPCSAPCAAQLASGGRSLLAADVCISVTGVGGPEPEGEHPAGEVHIGWDTQGQVGSQQFAVPGSPSEVVDRSVLHCLAVLREQLSSWHPPHAAARPSRPRA